MPRGERKRLFGRHCRAAGAMRQAEAREASMGAGEGERGADIAEAVAFARRFVGLRHPDAQAAILAGSRARGEAAAASDYDIVLLFRSLPEGAWREMTEFESRSIELFAHDLGTLSYFCREIDRPSGMPVLPRMVAEGVVIAGAGTDMLCAAQRRAAETLAAGPPPLDEAALAGCRFAITELAAALGSDRGSDVRLAGGAALSRPWRISRCAPQANGARPARRFPVR
jgi:hypothetical protein